MSETKEKTEVADETKTEDVSKNSKETKQIDEKSLSNKELKELKKQQKAAKRAATKEASGIPSDAVAKKQTNVQAKSATAVKKQLHSTVIKETRKIPSIFGHLETKEQRNSISPKVANIVHHSILALSLKYSNYSIVGSIPRVRAMLETFKVVIGDYKTPENTTLTRHLTSHLSNQIEYLKTARPLSVSMGNSIRWLKQEISLIPIDRDEAEAKQGLIEKIDEFIKEKIEYSDKMIIEYASNHISNGDTVLTYGHSEVLKKLFLHCYEAEKKEFNVIIVDSRPLFEGKKMVKELVNKGLKCQYVLINSLNIILDDVDTVFLGAHAMLSNGRLYSRVGTALVAMKAKSRNIPVLTCCESIKFSDKVQLDSVTTNELGDSNDLVQINSKPPQKKGFALEQFIKSFEDKSKQVVVAGEGDELPLANWESIPALNLLNIMYDLTPPEYIKKIITEVGSLPPSSVPVILREYKST